MYKFGELLRVEELGKGELTQVAGGVALPKSEIVPRTAPDPGPGIWVFPNKPIGGPGMVPGIQGAIWGSIWLPFM